MNDFEVMVKIGGNFSTRVIPAASPLSACKKAARHGGFTVREVSSAYVEEDSRMTFLSVRPGVSYTVFR